MLPFSSSRSSTFFMSNWAYLASRTPSARFSKSQNSAIFLISGCPAMLVHPVVWGCNTAITGAHAKQPGSCHRAIPRPPRHRVPTQADARPTALRNIGPPLRRAHHALLAASTLQPGGRRGSGLLAVLLLYLHLQRVHLRLHVKEPGFQCSEGLEQIHRGVDEHFYPDRGVLPLPEFTQRFDPLPREPESDFELVQRVPREPESDFELVQRVL